MPKLNHIVSCLAAILFSLSARAQLSEKDFKLLMDGREYPLYRWKISKDSLPLIKSFSPGFSWITLKGIDVHFGNPANTDKGYRHCAGTTVCEDVKTIMKMLQPGDIIIFEAEAYNKAGKLLSLQHIDLEIQ